MLFNKLSHKNNTIIVHAPANPPESDWPKLCSVGKLFLSCYVYYLTGVPLFYIFLLSSSRDQQDIQEYLRYILSMALAEMKRKNRIVRFSRPALEIYTVTFIHISLAKAGHLARPSDEREEVYAIYDNEAMARE